MITAAQVRSSLLVTSSLLALGLALSPGRAAAQPPALGGDPDAGPQEQACAGKAVGDACSMPNDQPGTCAEGTCSRLDYSGGSPPKATEEPCIVCEPGLSPGNPPDSGADAGGGDDGGSADASARDSSKEPPETGSRCSIVDEGSTPLPMALVLFGLGVAGVRRRRA